MKQVPLLTKEKLSCQYQDADNIAVPIIHIVTVQSANH